MKTLKLILLVVILPSLMMLTTNCNYPNKGKPDIDLVDILPDLDSLRECLNNCDSVRDQIDAEYFACIKVPMTQFLSAVEECREKHENNFPKFWDCFESAHENYEDKIADCKLEWEERKDEIKECKETCIRELWHY